MLSIKSVNTKKQDKISALDRRRETHPLCFGYGFEVPATYLGFHKGGTNFLWPLMLSRKGTKPCFPIFSYVQNWFFSGQRDMAQCPKLRHYSSVAILMSGHDSSTAATFALRECVNEAVSGVKPPAGKVEDGLLSWHGLHFWVWITFCKDPQGDKIYFVKSTHF